MIMGTWNAGDLILDAIASASAPTHVDLRSFEDAHGGKRHIESSEPSNACLLTLASWGGTCELAGARLDSGSPSVAVFASDAAKADQKSTTLPNKTPTPAAAFNKHGIVHQSAIGSYLGAAAPLWEFSSEGPCRSTLSPLAHACVGAMQQRRLLCAASCRHSRGEPSSSSRSPLAQLVSDCCCGVVGNASRSSVTSGCGKCAMFLESENLCSSPSCALSSSPSFERHMNMSLDRQRPAGDGQLEQPDIISDGLLIAENSLRTPSCTMTSH